MKITNFKQRIIIRDIIDAYKDKNILPEKRQYNDENNSASSSKKCKYSEVSHISL